MPADTDIHWMRRALKLARGGRGRVEPNPMVGCVLVRDGAEIGAGFHKGFGGTHAEVNAIAACQDTQGATAYVTLEPCCHENKKTPPCVPLLIAAKVGRVVLACADPNPQVAGKGIAQLREAGSEVLVGVCEAEAKQLNAAFFARMLHHRPYVTLKWAQTADGKVAGPGGRRLAITNAKSNALVHRLRSMADAILVGIGTLAADDPLLTARPLLYRGKQPLRIVMDSHLRMSAHTKLAMTTDEGRVRVYCLETARGAEGLLRAGVEVRRLRDMEPGTVLADLGRENLTHLFMEGGPTLARSWFASGAVDRVIRFTSPQRVDSDTAPAAPDVAWPVTSTMTRDQDKVEECLNPESDVYFAPQASADIVFE